VKGIIHATGAKPKMKLKSLMLSSNAAEPDIVIRPIPGALAMAVPPSPKLSNGGSHHPTLGQQLPHHIAKLGRYESPFVRPKQNIGPLGPLS
jgi:hypothetical protein